MIFEHIKGFWYFHRSRRLTCALLKCQNESPQRDHLRALISFDANANIFGLTVSWASASSLFSSSALVIATSSSPFPNGSCADPNARIRALTFTDYHGRLGFFDPPSPVRRAQYILLLLCIKTNAVLRPNERPTPLCSCKLYIRALLAAALQHLHLHLFTQFKSSHFGFGLLISLYSLTLNWTQYLLYNHLLSLFHNMSSQGVWYIFDLSVEFRPLVSVNLVATTILILSVESGYRQKLNNELQRIGDLPNLRYEFATVGPLHQATWTATATSTSQSK